MLRRLLDLLLGLPAAARSRDWPAVRDEHLRTQPECQACGRRDDLEVHHKRPVHLAPALELDRLNLVTLCRDCHFTFGHCRDWRAYNPRVDLDCENAREMFRRRRYE